MTVYVSRSTWTSEPRGGAQLTGTKLGGIACHWPGSTTDDYGVESVSRVASRLRGWWDFHVNTRGWSDIGYNFAIDQAGRVWDLRGLTRVGAHCASASNPDANHEWLGVLFILGDQEEPSAAMIQAFQDFRRDVFLPRWPGRLKLTGHGRAPGVPGAQTACPGPFVADRLTDGTLARFDTEDDMELTDRITLTAGQSAHLGGNPTIEVGHALAYAAAGGFRYINDRANLASNVAEAVVAKLPDGSVDAAVIRSVVQEVVTAELGRLELVQQPPA